MLIVCTSIFNCHIKIHYIFLLNFVYLGGMWILRYRCFVIGRYLARKNSFYHENSQWSVIDQRMINLHMIRESYCVYIRALERSWSLKKKWFWLRKFRGGYTLGLFKARVFKNESVKFLGCRPSHTWELRDREVSTVQNQVKIPRGVWHYWAYLERFCRCVLKNLGVQTSIQRLGHFGFLLHTCSRHGTIGKGGFF